MRSITVVFLACWVVGCGNEQNQQPAEESPVAQTAPAPAKAAPEAPAPAKAAPATPPPAPETPAPALPDLPEDRGGAKADFIAICNAFGELMGDGYGNQDVVNSLNPLPLKTEWGKAYRGHLNKVGEGALDGENKTLFLGFAKTLDASTNSNCKITVEVLEDL